MARVITQVIQMVQSLTGGYEPAKHYMRGPGPACRAKERSSSQQADGSDSRLVVADSDLPRVSPDSLGALLRTR